MEFVPEVCCHASNGALPWTIQIETTFHGSSVRVVLQRRTDGWGVWHLGGKIMIKGAYSFPGGSVAINECEALWEDDGEKTCRVVLTFPNPCT